jgi:hypothetical protein
LNSSPPENVIITPYASPELIFLAARNRNTGEYQDRDETFKLLDFKRSKVKSFNFRSVKEITEALSAFKNKEEGFVYWDGKLRLKFKSHGYLAAHLFKSMHMLPTGKILFDLFKEDSLDDLYVYNPEYASFADDFINKLKALKAICDAKFDSLKDEKDIKVFALAISNDKEKPFLFAMRKAFDFYDYFKSLSWKSVQGFF